MPFHDYPANRQTQPWTRASLAMQAYEWLEDVFQVGRLQSRAVVPNGKEPLFRTFFRSDVDDRGDWTPVLKSVVDEILEHLHQAVRIPRHPRELIVGYSSVISAEFPIQLSQDGSK